MEKFIHLIILHKTSCSYCIQYKLSLNFIIQSVSLTYSIMEKWSLKKKTKLGTLVYHEQTRLS